MAGLFDLKHGRNQKQKWDTKVVHVFIQLVLLQINCLSLAVLDIYQKMYAQYCSYFYSDYKLVDFIQIQY